MLEINYSFEDTHLSAQRNYYKLKQRDFDGRVTYSKVIVINNLAGTISLFPNNVTDILNVSLGNNKGNYEIKILNSMGQTISKTKNQNKLNLADIIGGIYFVYIVFDNQNTWSGKITKN